MSSDAEANTDPKSSEDAQEVRGASRRRFLGAAAGATGVLVAGGVGGWGVARATATDRSTATEPTDLVYPFYGTHQGGIATPAQDRLAFAAFDITATDPAKVAVLLGTWAAAAKQMTQGKPIGATETQPEAAPIDTGEAMGLGASGLTVTVGFGPSFFDDRFGLAGKRPAALAGIPALPGEILDASISNGDLCVQACANDPTVAFHVVRNFARLARGVAVLRWSQLGFGRTSSTSVNQETPRNLMGFKDGTNNIKAEDTGEMEKFVWVGSETDQPWMQNGSYVVTRRVRMLVETWDNNRISDQERIFGRTRDSGAPLTGKAEHDTVNLTAKDSQGELVIDAASHIRLAAPANHGGLKILRRGYSYTDGIEASTGLLDAGLFFIAYQKDPRTQFVPIQRALGTDDSLNEYIRHTSSALFAVPPGLSEPGDWYGKSLFT